MESFFRFVGGKCRGLPNLQRPRRKENLILGPIFRTIFPGKIFGENSGENFPTQNVGKNGIFRGKSFEKSFFQEVLRNFPLKVIFRGKKCTKNRPLVISLCW
jgi:hypothetical protein